MNHQPNTCQEFALEANQMAKLRAAHGEATICCTLQIEEKSTAYECGFYAAAVSPKELEQIPWPQTPSENKDEKSFVLIKDSDGYMVIGRVITISSPNGKKPMVIFDITEAVFILDNNQPD